MRPDAPPAWTKKSPAGGRGICGRARVLTRRCYLTVILKPMDVRLIVTPGTVFTKTFG